MWWLDLGFVQALAMDIGMTLFVMVYTVVFH
ncbi:chlorhexidine efflux transporter [Kingella negevensis]|nr:chlorhexidine efflux transporter [Kingella negevensis]WII93430.1 chlorhexidine efflux transporter [Kingella negevensis]